jgi:predicted protein tyrosine phosphatase
MAPSLPKITIASFELATTLLGLSERNFHHVISINDPETKPPETLTGHSARSLILYFHDILMCRPGTESAYYSCPTRDDVHEIVRFARGISLEHEVLIHCAAGISRSSAAALTVLAAKLKPSKKTALHVVTALLESKSTIFPNATMVGYADDLLGYKDELTKAYERKFGRHSEDFGELEPLTANDFR